MTDQTGWKPRLIWVFTGHTGHFVGFVMLWLKLRVKTLNTSNISWKTSTGWKGIPILDEWCQSMTKQTKWPVCSAKTQISLGICPVWSESSLCVLWTAKDPNILQRTAKSDQTGQMPTLIRVFAGRTGHFVCSVKLRLFGINLFLQQNSKVKLQNVM